MLIASWNSHSMRSRTNSECKGAEGTFGKKKGTGNQEATEVLGTVAQIFFREDWTRASDKERGEMQEKVKQFETSLSCGLKQDMLYIDIDSQPTINFTQPQQSLCTSTRKYSSVDPRKRTRFLIFLISCLGDDQQEKLFQDGPPALAAHSVRPEHIRKPFKSTHKNKEYFEMRLESKSDKFAMQLSAVSAAKVKEDALTRLMTVRNPPDAL